MSITPFPLITHKIRQATSLALHPNTKTHAHPHADMGPTSLLLSVWVDCSSNFCVWKNLLFAKVNKLVNYYLIRPDEQRKFIVYAHAIHVNSIQKANEPHLLANKREFDDF